MPSLKLGSSDWKRGAAQEPRVYVQNRYFESNPTNLVEGSSLIRRPGLKRWLSFGSGPCRGLYSQPGSFNTCLFVASGTELYRVDGGAAQFIGGGLANNTARGYVSMTSTGNIGSTPEYLYVADGNALYLYMSAGYGFSTLNGTPSNNDTLSIQGVYYKWTSGSVNVGTPAGTLANPWLVSLGSLPEDPMTNMALAIAVEGTAGSTYSTGLITPNPGVTYQAYGTNYLTVRTLDTTTVVSLSTTATDVAWSSTSIVGGSQSFTQVQVPDGLGIISVGYIASFVICAVAPGTDYKGRFFWIEPGETIIRPLNFATAEQSPDPIYGVRVVGDQLWLLGESTTEVWYPTGDGNAPFARTQGQVFDRGVWQGTDVQVKENLFIIDSTGAVYNLAGGLNRISNPGIEQRIREAMQNEVKGQ